METNNGAEFLEIIRKGLRKNNFQIPAKTRKFIKDKFDETCK